MHEDLSADGPAFYLTNLKSGRALQPALELVDDQLYLAYNEEKANGENAIRLLRLPASFSGQPKQTVQTEEALKGINLRSQPRKIAQQRAPQLSCDDNACMVVWDDEKAGSFAAFIQHDSERALWYSEFSHSAKRPNIKVSRAGSWAIAFYDEDRLKMMLADSNGLHKPSVLTKVSGYQPTPDLLKEDEAGSWLLAWRDFEAGHKEVFVARAHCFQENSPQ